MEKQSKLQHFHLGLLSEDDPPGPHYNPPPHMFRSSEQTFPMEVHQPFRYIFYHILLRRIFKI